MTEPMADRRADPTADPVRDTAARKRELRRQLLAARVAAGSADAADAADAAVRLAAVAAEHFAIQGMPSSVAAYLSIGSEPDTRPLIEAVAERGAKVIVPVLRPDADLDWAPYVPGADVVAGPRGTIQPVGATLGVDAICAVDIVFVPALAVDRDGRRLGRGGGCFDRALARLRAAGSTARVFAIIHDDEFIDEVPSHDHDQRVDGVLTPTQLAEFDHNTPS